MEPSSNQNRLNWAILEYLSSVRAASGSNPTQAQSLSTAIDQLQNAFGISLNSDSDKTAHSSAPLDLVAAFSFALANKAAAVAAAPKPSATSSSEDFTDPDLKEKFNRYVDLLAKRGFFNGCDQGSSEYNDRLSKAKARFLSKYAQEQQEAAAAAAAKATSSTAEAAPASAPAAPVDKNAGLTDSEKVEKAEGLKNEGNQKLSSRQYADAINLYSEAIQLNPRNAIYYSNRAAAYSHIGEHQKAIQDCNAAIKLDPKYSKAYSRLGLAYFSLGKYREAVEFGYKKAVELEPNNATAKESLAAAEAKIAELEAASSTPATAAANPGAALPNPFAGGANPFGGAGGNPLAGMNPELMREAMNAMGGGGGLAGLAGLMNNPAFAQMAQSMLSNPAFMNMAQNLASNPDILRNFGSMFGGQPPAGGNPGPENDDDAMNM